MQLELMGIKRLIGQDERLSHSFIISLFSWTIPKALSFMVEVQYPSFTVLQAPLPISSSNKSKYLSHAYLIFFTVTSQFSCFGSETSSFSWAYSSMIIFVYRLRKYCMIWKAHKRSYKSALIDCLHQCWSIWLWEESSTFHPHKCRSIWINGQMYSWYLYMIFCTSI